MAKKKLNLNFWNQHCCVFQKWVWKTHSGGGNHFYTLCPVLRLIFMRYGGKVSARVVMKWSPRQEENTRGLCRRVETKWRTRSESAATWENTQGRSLLPFRRQQLSHLLSLRNPPPARDSKDTGLNSFPPHAFSLCTYLHASSSFEAKDSLIQFKLPTSVNPLPQHLNANTN